MGSGVVERCEPELVEQDQVVAEQGVDGLADGVVGESAVEGLDDVGGGEVPDPVPVGDRGVAERDEQMALAGAGGSDEAEVLRGADPLERGEVVEGRGWDRGAGDVEPVEGLGDREPRGAQSGAGVGLVAGSDFGFDEGARRNSSGDQRWVLAVTSSSGASRRIADIFNRFRPSVRSAGSAGGAAAVTSCSHRQWRRSCRR